MLRQGEAADQRAFSAASRPTIKTNVRWGKERRHLWPDVRNELPGGRCGARRRGDRVTVLLGKPGELCSEFVQGQASPAFDLGESRHGRLLHEAGARDN